MVGRALNDFCYSQLNLLDISDHINSMTENDLIALNGNLHYIHNLVQQELEIRVQHRMNKPYIEDQQRRMRRSEDENNRRKFS